MGHKQVLKATISIFVGELAPSFLSEIEAELVGTTEQLNYGLKVPRCSIHSSCMFSPGDIWGS
ncbi:hypothetical protein M569_16437 [Genlisea aurea]|uniref:Uncharacterized protein n=1 Tax=Genlisea aurea TaxID=192259 RepID=S8DGB2_9LAMI|nr:hypothetical protein M569_16437 [Genlisea aurea]